MNLNLKDGKDIVKQELELTDIENSFHKNDNGEEQINSAMLIWNSEFQISDTDDKFYERIDKFVHIFYFVISFLNIATMFLPGNLDDFKSNDAKIYKSLFKGLVGMYTFNVFSLRSVIKSFNNTKYNIPQLLQTILYPIF
jgi:hypothetical protein